MINTLLFEDMEVKLDELDDSGFQLTLPSGATVGHRSLVRSVSLSVSLSHFKLTLPSGATVGHRSLVRSVFLTLSRSLTLFCLSPLFPFY